jgi:hyaluronan synthase
LATTRPLDTEKEIDIVEAIPGLREAGSQGKETPATERPSSRSQEDFYAHCHQRIAESGRIKISRKAWAFRIFFLAGFILMMSYTILIALSAGDMLIIYASVIVVHSLAVLVIGWFRFKNKATGAAANDLVSVVIPVFNQEKLIGQVVNAVSDSTYQNLEIIVVNDGSKDNTAAVLDAIAESNPRVKVIHKPNGGKRTAVAAAFYASHGRFIVLIDSDSIVDKYAIEELMKVFSANPKVGGVVGNAKVLNADKNILTRCQDVWYDNAFNIHKAAESTFGTVQCLSGCLSAYRRQAIFKFIPFWAADKTQYSDDRTLTTYTIATEWAKKQFAPLERRLMNAMASYDDAEDRALTSQAMKEWDTVYAPTAVVYTEVPDKFKGFMRQQTRWKKGYMRSAFFASAFFWRKNPLMAFLFYLDFMSSFILPVVAFSIFFYRPIFLNSYWFLATFTAGQVILGLGVGLDYKFRDKNAKNWIYKPVMNLFAAVVLSWVLLPAIWGFRKKGWLTR